MEKLNENVVIFNGDCLNIMNQLIEKNVKIDLTVTSPPYDDMRNYKNTCFWNFEIFKQVANKLYDLTSKGGVVVWIIGDKTHKGNESGSSFKQALYFKEIGFNLHDTMIWRKTNPFNFGSNNCYIQSFEYMFIFSKGKPKSLNLIYDRKNKTSGKINKQRRRENNGDFMEEENKNWEVKNYGKRYNVWDINCSKKVDNHTATFPNEIPRDHILSWSNEEDIIFDPFLGSGTTGIESIKLNRKFIGIELVEEYYELSKERLNKTIKNLIDNE